MDNTAGYFEGMRAKEPETQAVGKEGMKKV